MLQSLCHMSHQGLGMQWHRKPRATYVQSEEEVLVFYCPELTLHSWAPTEWVFSNLRATVK